MKGYGVFHNDILIFSGVMTYAIYEKRPFAESFMREMQGYYPDVAYSVREIELNAEGAHGASYKEEIEK
jgi:hypothetical protein